MSLERSRWLGQSFSGPAPTREQQLEQMVREYYEMIRAYEEHFFFRASEKERTALQQRAKRLLERGNEHAR